MHYLIKTGLVLFILGWSLFGIWLVAKYAVLFGPHHDNPSETVGARSFGVTHIGVVWIGLFVLALHFLFR